MLPLSNKPSGIESAELPVAHLTLLTRWETHYGPGLNTSARFHQQPGVDKTKRRLLRYLKKETDEESRQEADLLK
ncbi:hypothetical protein SRHO_G00333650 [Serrasalmus rhombeus]